MTAKRKPIQIDPESELAITLQRAAADGEPVVVDTGDEIFEIDVHRTSGTQTPANMKPSPEQAARTGALIHRASGGWVGLVDADEFTDYIYERRRTAGRPPFHP